METREVLERLEAEGGEQTAALAWLAVQGVELDPASCLAARRRALLVLASGGDPRRDLEPDSRAVVGFADELDEPEPASRPSRGRSRHCGRRREGLPTVASTLEALAADGELAWRWAACGCSRRSWPNDPGEWLESSTRWARDRAWLRRFSSARFLAGCGGSGGDEPSSYALAPTRACLQSEDGVTVNTKDVDFVATTALGGAMRVKVSPQNFVVMAFGGRRGRGGADRGGLPRLRRQADPDRRRARAQEEPRARLECAADGRGRSRALELPQGRR
jgi:hypothetical protein